VVSPYVALFHSSHFGDDNPMREMSDVMLGSVTRWQSLVVDARYTYYNTSPVMRGAVHELGVRASVDALASWQQTGQPCTFGLRPYAGLYGDISDEQGTEDVYLETGLEPSGRFEVAGSKVGVSAPLFFGLSVDDYYFDSNGDNAFLGYFSAGVTASVALPVPDRWGEWFLNASFQYLHLFADNLAAINDGDREVFIGKVGIGLAF
jgi:hypothetical protein